MTRRVIVVLALAIMLGAAGLFGLSQCQRARTVGTQAKVAKGQVGNAIRAAAREMLKSIAGNGNPPSGN